MADSYLGEIRIFAGNFAPVGWHLCDGSLLSIAEYNALYALLGTTYGGDGVSTFGVPDLRGRLAVGQGNGTGLTPRVMGQSFGTEIANAAWPVHTHTLMASSSAAAIGTPGGNVLATTTTDVPLYDVKSNPKAFDARAINSAGGSQPHMNVMPSSCINFIISTSGYFPSRP
jgi:microcystin-dependent protein